MTIAKATLSDRLELLAFKYFYIDADHHASSRYTIEFNVGKESQSSNGILVPRSSGYKEWLSSLFNMANMINGYNNSYVSDCGNILNWNADQLVFVLRAHFLSKQSQTTIVYAIIKGNKILKTESNMPTIGYIFSDSIESDFSNFHSRSIWE